MVVLTPAEMGSTMTLTTRTIEKVALGKALRHGDPLNPENFRFPPHPEICRAIIAVRTAGQRVGLRTVSEWLHAQGQLDAVGGTLYLAELMLTIDR